MKQLDIGALAKHSAAARAAATDYIRNVSIRRGQSSEAVWACHRPPVGVECHAESIAAPFGAPTYRRLQFG